MKKVLSLILALVLLLLTFTGVLTYVEADSIDGDHMQDASGANSYASDQVVRKGWGYIQGNTLFAIAGSTRNYGITYDELPFLVVTFANSRQVADGAPAALSECTTTRKVIAAGLSQTTTGFQPVLRTTDNTGFPSTTYFCYTWMAIGKHSSSYNGETDPQVGSNVTNYIPRWNGTALVSGSLYNDAGKVGIGTATPSYALDINSSGDSFKVGSGNTWIRTWTSINPSLSFSDGAGYRAGYIWGGQNLYGSNILKFLACDDSGNCPASFYAHQSGNFGIGNEDPSHKLTIANSTTDDVLRLMGPESYGHGARLNFGDADYAYIEEDVDDGLYLYAVDRTAIIGGNVGIGVANPSEKLHISGNMRVPSGFSIINENSRAVFHTGWSGVFGDYTVINSGYDWEASGEPMSVVAGRYGVFFTKGDTNGNPYSQTLMRISDNGNVGIGTTSPSALLHVNGRTKTRELEITGGADIAEPFDISGENNPEPGSVVVIDEQRTGHLKLSSAAYDKRVAGIISGAGGINPGLTLKQEDLMEGEQNVAISGRVYVKADASNGEINPGDLLTTSESLGYAMKVTNHQRAQGAIIGKAMSPLSSGEGLVLVLVTLQ